MSDTVASLGFDINSQPVKDAKEEIKGLGEAAEKSSGQIGKLQPSMQTLEAQAKRAGISVDELKARTASFNAESSKMATATTAASSALGAVAKDAAAVAPALTAVGAATKAVTAEHNAHANSIKSLRGDLRAMSPLLNEFGSGLGSVTQFAKAARFGLEGLAVVAGGALLVALAKVGDEVERTKSRLAGLTGSADAGAKAYNSVTEAAKSSGVAFSALEGAVESALIGQEKFADKNVIYANTAERAAEQTAKLSSSFGTFGEILRTNSTTAEQEAAAFKALGESLKETGKITADAFNKIREQSPGAALDIAKAFGFQTVKDFNAEIEKAPITLDQWIKRLAEVKPLVDAAFNAKDLTPMSDAIRALTAQWGEFTKELSKNDTAVGAIKILTDALKLLPQILEQDAKDIKLLVEAFDAIKAAANSSGSAISGFVLGALSSLGNLASQAVSLAAKTAGAIASIANAAFGGGGGGSPASLSDDGFGGIQLSPSSGGGDYSSSYGGSSGGAVSSGGFDSGAMDYGGGSADYGYFADGGQFAVKGSGGTDSQTVSFKATPGEVVTISTPDSAAATSSSDSIQGLTTIQGAPAGSVKAITDAIKDSTIQVVTSVNTLTAVTAAPLKNPSTGLSFDNAALDAQAAAYWASKGIYGPGTSGGGGVKMGKGDGEFGSPWNLNDQGPSKDEAALSAAGYYGNMNYGGGMFRGTQPIRSRTQSAGSFPMRRPVGSASASWGGGYSYSGGIDAGSFDYLDSGYYDTGYASVGSPTTDAFNDYGIDYGGNDGGAFGTGGSSVWDSANQYMNDGGSSYTMSSGFDSGPVMGDSYYAGGFASGGAFTVPGSGSTDKTLIALHATAGEQVSVRPMNSVNKPTLPARASQRAVAAMATPQAITKNINFYMQSGQQANDFIKSRAQIARMMQ